MQDWINRQIEQLKELAMAAQGKEPATMTESERLAICLAAGCDITTESDEGDPTKIRFKTVNPCAIQMVNGRLHVFEQKAPPIKFKD